MYLQVDDTNPALSEEQFIERWNNYVSDIEKYREIGLLDFADTVLDDKELKKAYHNKGAFLCVYLETFEETLRPLERAYNKFKLFVDILNERNRVTKKVLSYGKTGMILTVNGEKLPLSCMSSGEKNDFIMFYNLIFNSNNDGVVLIDEPEISLHIEWQESFLDSLVKICEMNGLQAIVATHSPNIVNGHFELYAEKGLIDD
jgi:predicted ATP-dependent endonuclease of OLD family